jgi:cell filamentation protein
MREFERNVLRRYSPQHIDDDKDFGRAAAHIQGEFLSIHPFREGNARTIKLLTDLLASQTGRPLLRYDMSPAGRRLYIDAAKAALHEKDYQPMEAVIRQALEAAIIDA